MRSTPRSLAPSSLRAGKPAPATGALPARLRLAACSAPTRSASCLAVVRIRSRACALCLQASAHQLRSCALAASLKVHAPIPVRRQRSRFIGPVLRRRTGLSAATRHNAGLRAHLLYARAACGVLPHEIPRSRNQHYVQVAAAQSLCCEGAALPARRCLSSCTLRVCAASCLAAMCRCAACACAPCTLRVCAASMPCRIKQLCTR